MKLLSQQGGAFSENKKTLYYNDLDTEDSILHPVNSDDDDDDDDRLVQKLFQYLEPCDGQTNRRTNSTIAYAALTARPKTGGW